jgi:lipopolysaccharide export system permease protein
MIFSSTKTGIPRLFYSYLATEMLAPFFATFLIMNGVFFLIKLIPFLNLVLELNIGLGDFIRLFSYLFPNMFLYSIPMASMLGITIGFSRLANDSEILAFKASGIGIYQALPPLIGIALIISLITGYFSIRLIPAGDTAMQHMMYQLAKEKIDKGIKERTFTEALGDLVVHIDSVDKKTGAWDRVWVSDMRDRETPAITMARSGTMYTDLDVMEVTLALEQGTMQIPEGEKAQTISFNRYIIKLPLSLPAQAPNFKKRGTMNMAELMDRAREAGLNTPSGRSYHTEFHKRLVLPIGCLFLSLLGMPLGLQAGPGRRAIGVPFGLIFYISYYVMFTMSRNMATSGDLPVPVVMWIPNTLFFLLAVILINRVAHEKPLVTPFVQTIFDRMINAIIGWSKSFYQWLRIDIFTSRRLPASVDSDQKKILRGNARNRIFHFPECDYYYAKDCSVEFKNSHVALKAGFEPCMFCRTILADKQKQEQLPDEPGPA